MAIEQTLASMAHRQLTQNMPSLASNLLGFELIANNDENTFALGVNVAIIGDTYVYIPTILKNGRIAPVDLMYVPELDQFLPCKDAWITYLQSKKTDLMAAVRQKKGGTKGGPGNVDLTMPFDSITKVASDDFAGILGHAKNSMVEALCSAPASFHIPCVSELIDHAPVNGLKKLASYIESTEGHDALAEFYTIDEINNIINKVDTKLKNAEVILPTQEGTVKILTSASTEAKTIPNEDKVKILRDGAVIKDSRGLTTSTVYKTKTNSEWVTPAHDGLYELLKVDGSTLTAYVVNADTARGEVSTKHNQGLPSFYVIPLDDGQKRVAYEVRKKRILGQPYPNTDEFPVKGNNISSVGSVRSSIIIDKDKKAYPISICGGTRVVKAGDEIYIYGTVCPDYTDTNKIAKSTKHQLGAVGFTNRATAFDESYQQLDGIIIGKPGSKTREAGNFLRVGSDASYVEIANRYDAEDTVKAVQLLADDSSLINAISNRENHISVILFKADNGVYIDSELVKTAGAKPIEAEKALVERLVMDPEDAHELVKNASAKPETYLVKMASESELMIRATDRAPEDISNESLTLTPTKMSDEDKRLMDNAVNTGVKEVFDVSILRMLAEEDAPDQIINEWIPALFTALDKLGRILYLCRSGESMQDVYGIARVDDVERKLRKQFNALGDIILTMLKGKVNSIEDLLNGEM